MKEKIEFEFKLIQLCIVTNLWTNISGVLLYISYFFPKLRIIKLVFTATRKKTKASK